MRQPIHVNSEPFDIESVQPLIDEARINFADYLDHVRRSTKSKHGLMGPVGKLFSEIKAGRRDSASLKGYVVRVHESTGKSPTCADMERVEAGIDTTVRLLATAPIAFHDTLLDRLDYGLYYELRKRQLASKESRKQAWIGYLRQKYVTEEAVAEAWDETGFDFEELYVPRRADGSTKKSSSARQRDIAEFWNIQLNSSTTELEEEE